MRGGSKSLDEFLVLECQAGNTRAVAHLAARWHSRLLYRARAQVGDPEGAQEVAQEAWLAIVKGLTKLQDPARFSAWSYRIVQNKAADWIRRNQRQRQHEVEPRQEPAARGPAEVAQPAVLALRIAIKNLPPDQKRAIELFYLEELSIRQIAMLLQIAEGTVKSRLFHARKQLKQTLEGQR